MAQTKSYFVLLTPCILNGIRALQLLVWIPLLKLRGERFLEPQWQHFLCCSYAIALALFFPWPFTCCRPQQFKGRNYYWSLLPSPLLIAALGLHLGNQYMLAESLTAWGPPSPSPPSTYRSLSFLSCSSSFSISPKSNSPL